MVRHDNRYRSRSSLPVAAWPVLGATVVSLLLVGCSGEQEGRGSVPGPTDPGMGHVHGLGTDGPNGDVLAATHTGLFRLREGVEPERVADRRQDTMAFTTDGDRLLGSGHPDVREDLPAHLGLIQSTDAGQTWSAVSLQGDADFHALSVLREQVVGWDSLSRAVLASSDGGRSWVTGAELEAVADLEHLPGDGGLLATTAQGLLVSQDAGRTFDPFTPAAPRPLLYVETTGDGVTGMDTEGRVWTLVDGGWGETGTLGAAPAAFTVTADGALLAAAQEQVLRSEDAQAWTVLADLHGGAG